MAKAHFEPQKFLESFSTENSILVQLWHLFTCNTLWNWKKKVEGQEGGSETAQLERELNEL